MLDFECAVRAWLYDRKVVLRASYLVLTMVFWALLHGTGCMRVFLAPVVYIARCLSSSLSSSYITWPMSHVLRVWSHLNTSYGAGPGVFKHCS